jgi:hypothetical protein
MRIEKKSLFHGIGFALKESGLLAISAGLVPLGLGRGASQNRQENQVQGRTELLAWAQSQKPDPVPSPKPVPLPDQQPEHPPAPQQPPYGPPDDTQKESARQTFDGTILKSGKKYVLKTEDKAPYDLDDQERAQKYEGKKVQVVGTLDEASRLIHVQEMKAAA